MSENVFELSEIQELSEREDYGIYKKYIGIWEQPNALDIFLDVIGSEEYIYKLTSTSFKKKQVWDEIARKVESRGILLGDNPCKIAYQKWLNLKKNFISVLNKKSGKTPPWFGKLNELIEKSEGKLLGNVNLQGGEQEEEIEQHQQQQQQQKKEQEKESKEPMIKKMKQEFLPAEEEGAEEPEVHIQIDPGQYVIEEVGQVNYGDVVAIMQQLELERREREEAREKREKERFDKLANLIKQQNVLTEKLIAILTKQSNVTPPGDNDNHNQLPADPSARIISAEDIQH